MSVKKTLIWAVPIAVLLLVLPQVVDPYPTILLAYGLVMAIAVLGFNLLLGYTGLLSFGHSAYFGVGTCTSSRWSCSCWVPSSPRYW